jgi:hypothetical protein
LAIRARQKGQKERGVPELEGPAWYLGQGLFMGLTHYCGDTLEGEPRTDEADVV